MTTKKIDNTDKLLSLMEEMVAEGVRIAAVPERMGIEVVRTGGLPRWRLASLRLAGREIYDLLMGTPILSCPCHGEQRRLPRDPSQWSAEQRQEFPRLHARMTAVRLLLAEGVR